MRVANPYIVATLSTGLLVAAAAVALLGAAARAETLTPPALDAAMADDDEARPRGAFRDPLAADSCRNAADGAGCFVVLIDHLRRMRFDEPVRTVLVGNPAIADVTMISATEGVISARSVGSTNMIFLGENGDALGDFEVLVREGESQRVVLRRGPREIASYQCAPRCERTLTQSDTTEVHSELAAIVTTETSINEAAASGAADQAAQPAQ